MNHRPRTTPPLLCFPVGYATFTLLATESAFRELEEYLLTVAEFIERNKNAFTESVSTAVQTAGLTGDDADCYYEAHQNEFCKWDDTFPNIVLSSVLMSACALFEGRLTDVVRDLDDDVNIVKVITWSDTQGTGIRRVNNYFRSNFEILLSDSSKWTDLLAVYTIRDVFVHALGRPDLGKPASRPRLDAAVRRFAPNVAEDHVGRLSINIAFVKRVIEGMLECWRELAQASRDNAVLGPAYWR